LILAVALIAAWLAYPPKEKISLGLDLRGGMHLLLQVHTEDALRAETDSDMAALVDRAKEKGVVGLKARRTGDSAFAVAATSEQRDVLSDLAQRYLSRWNVSSSGDDMVFTMKTTEANTVRNAAVNQAKTTIDNRINQFGVTEPLIQATSTGYRIVVQLPGVDDPERVRRRQP
jgi:preprotein translocase subunit SecD